MTVSKKTRIKLSVEFWFYSILLCPQIFPLKTLHIIHITVIMIQSKTESNYTD